MVGKVNEKANTTEHIMMELQKTTNKEQSSKPPTGLPTPTLIFQFSSSEMLGFFNILGLFFF